MRVVPPLRLAGFECSHSEALAGTEGHLARALDEFAHLGFVDAPRLAEAQLAVDGAEIAPARPALGLAHRADHAAQAARGIVGVGERARHVVLELEQALVARLRAHVAADAAVAEERAV